MEIPKWNSSKIIGRIKERHAKLEHKSLDYRSFYNGWIEGRIDMLVELRVGKTEDTSKNSLHKHDVSKCEGSKREPSVCPNCGSTEYHLGYYKRLMICEHCDYSQRAN